MRYVLKNEGYREVSRDEWMENNDDGDCFFYFEDGVIYFKLKKEENYDDYLDLTKEENQRKYLGIIEDSVYDKFYEITRILLPISLALSESKIEEP